MHMYDPTISDLDEWLTRNVVLVQEIVTKAVLANCTASAYEREMLRKDLSCSVIVALHVKTSPHMTGMVQSASELSPVRLDEAERIILESEPVPVVKEALNTADTLYTPKATFYINWERKDT